MRTPFFIEDYLSEEKYKTFTEASARLNKSTRTYSAKALKELDEADKVKAYNNALKDILSKDFFSDIVTINTLLDEANNNYIASFNGDIQKIFDAMAMYCSDFDDSDFEELSRSFKHSSKIISNEYKDLSEEEKEKKLFAYNFIETAQAFSYFVKPIIDTRLEEKLASALSVITENYSENPLHLTYKDIPYHELLENWIKNSETIGERMERLEKARDNAEKKQKKAPKKQKYPLDISAFSETEKAFPSTVHDDFSRMVSSPAIYLLMEVINSGNNIEDIPIRKKSVSHGTTYTVKSKGDKRLITADGKKNSLSIEVSDITKMTKGSKPAKKLTVLCLVKANEQALHNGELGRNYISFPLQELVDNGMYSYLRSARQGFESGMDNLTSLKVKGSSKKTSKREVSQTSLRVLFTGYDIDNNQCKVYLNTEMNWSFIAQYYTILPNYYFKLSNKTSDLLLNIFLLARQHTQDISEKGYFDISFRSIHSTLNLPNEKKTKNPQRDIKDVIDDAVSEIETAHGDKFGFNDKGKLDFSLMQMYEEDWTISEYLDKGYLRVYLKGNFAQSFIDVQEDTEKKIATSKKRKEAIVDKAKAMNLAKSMEKEKETAT